MDQEMLQVQQLNTIFTEFTTVYEEIIKQNITKIGNFFKTLSDAAETYGEREDK
jgi:hypothetical protein